MDKNATERPIKTRVPMTDTCWARAAFTLCEDADVKDVLANRNMQTGLRKTTTGYCQFGGGRGTGWDQCHQSQMKSMEIRGFF